MSVVARLVLVCALSASTAVAAAAQGADDGAPAHETTYPSLRIRGFTDVVYATSDAPGGGGGFHLGQFVLHFASPVAKKVSFFGEVTASPRDREFRVEVERSLVRYDHNDYFKISFGRYHTPLGYWNAAFHHGLWLQTTVRRPAPVRFGGEFFPVHFVGLVAEGALPTGGAGLSWTGGVGNGRGLEHSRAGDAGDHDTHRAWMATLRAQPTRPFGLDLGAGVYRDEFALDSGVEAAEWIVAGHAAWIKETPEVILEYVAVVHDPEAGGVQTTNRGYYTQLAYRLPFDGHRWKPYGRFEEVDLDREETIFAPGDVQAVVAGVRYDIVALAAFKAEYRNELRRPGGRSQTLLLQTSLTF